MKRNIILIWLVVLFITGLLFGSGFFLSAKTTDDKYPLYKELELFADVLTIIQKSYVQEVSVQDLIYGAIKGVVATLDPHSQFLSPEAYKEMKIETKGEFGGLGVEITLKDGILTIVSPLEDTPAYRAGLKPGDKVIKIDGESTENITLNDAVKKLRGKPGSEVTLTIMRPGKKEFIDFTLERDYIKLESVKDAGLIAAGIGYIRIIQFQENTGEDLKKALKELHLGELKGLVLDLRNNPGGILQDAIEVAECFIAKPQMIVSTRGRLPDQNQEYFSENEEAFLEVPLVILINKGSASGAEIVAGAVKDCHRGILIGVQTFGKGSVQSVLPLRDGSALKLTTATYFTPKGTNINQVGIEPDIEIALSEEEEDKLWEARASKEKDAEKKIPLALDPQLERAVDLIKGLTVFQEIEKTITETSQRETETKNVKQ